MQVQRVFSLYHLPLVDNYISLMIMRTCECWLLNHDQHRLKLCIGGVYTAANEDITSRVDHHGSTDIQCTKSLFVRQ